MKEESCHEAAKTEGEPLEGERNHEGQGEQGGGKAVTKEGELP